MFAAPSRALHRRASATAAAAILVLAGGALSSCGFNEPTDRINTIAAGTAERGAAVDLLGMRVLSTTDGEGQLIGTLVNNEADDAALTGVSGEGVTAELDEIEVPGGGHVVLSDQSTPPVLLSGDFVAGDVITLEFTLEAPGSPATDTVSLGVPVVKDCFQYTQVPEPEALESETPATEDSDVVAEGTESPAEEPEERESEPLEEDVDPAYLCEHPTTGHEPEEGED
jgi:hypothetical protein